MALAGIFGCAASCERCNLIIVCLQFWNDAVESLVGEVSNGLVAWQTSFFKHIIGHASSYTSSDWNPMSKILGHYEHRESLLAVTALRIGRTLYTKILFELL